MLRVIAVYGHKGAGKTRMVEWLVKRLSQEGCRVGTVKHVHHRGLTVDVEGKDTWRHARAGAIAVAALSPDRGFIHYSIGGESRAELERVLRFLGGIVDIVVLEGFHHLTMGDPEVAKIVLLPSGAEYLESSAPPKLGAEGPSEEVWSFVKGFVRSC